MTPPRPAIPHLRAEGNPTTTYADAPGGGRVRRTELPTACGRTAPLTDITMRRDLVRCPDCAGGTT